MALLFTQSPGTDLKEGLFLIPISTDGESSLPSPFTSDHNFNPNEGLHTKDNKGMNYFSCVSVVFLTDICVCLFLGYKMQLSCSLKYTCKMKNMLSQLAA